MNWLVPDWTVAISISKWQWLLVTIICMYYSAGFLVLIMQLAYTIGCDVSMLVSSPSSQASIPSIYLACSALWKQRFLRWEWTDRVFPRSCWSSFFWRVVCSVSFISLCLFELLMLLLWALHPEEPNFHDEKQLDFLWLLQHTNIASSWKHH